MCSHGLLFCDVCGHQANHLDGTHYFANRMQEMVRNPHTIGEFSCVGLLWEYNNMMNRV